MSRLKRFLRIIPSILFAVLGFVVLWLHFDSYENIRSIRVRRPAYELWLTSERYRIQLAFEHPGRSDERYDWLSSDKCRDLSDFPFRMTSIGYSDDVTIPQFEVMWARPTPAHMRPAKRYSILFPHGYLVALLFVLAALLSLKSCARRAS